MFQRGPWLGQVPLILGPSSWGAGMIPLAPIGPPVAYQQPCPPDSVQDPETGECVYLEPQPPTVPTVPYGSFF